ncbi:MAG TPA: TMEM43 family protein [Caulobacteraceae bacterium]|jgi:hypothetical protein
MSDQYTEVTTQGFFSRLGSSLAGLLLGPLLIIGAIWLLAWNEGRAVQALSGLGDASKSLVEASANAVSPANEGKLVHVVGPATAATPIEDPDVGVKFKDQVAVGRTAQMYAWEEKQRQTTHDNLGGGRTTTTTYTYDQAWLASPPDSSKFKHPDGHQNPDMAVTSTRWSASDAKLGGYTLDPDVLKLADVTSPLQADAPKHWQAVGGALYKGDPDAPKAGDLKVSYLGLASGSTLSVLADQSHGGFAPFQTKNGYQIEMVKDGNQPAPLMLAAKRGSESTMTWLLRVIGFVAMVSGFSMFLGPISTFAAVIPFLGSIARGAAMFAAVVISVPITLVVVALAWIAFRPLIGIALLVVGAGLFFGLHRLHQMRHPAPVAAA